MTSAGEVNGSGPKTPTSISRNKSERERKIGHRRVGVGGEITYKKVYQNSKGLPYHHQSSTSRLQLRVKLDTT